MRRRRTAAAALLVSLLAAPLPGRAQTVQWQPEQTTTPSTTGIQWTPESETPASSDGVVWQALPEDTPAEPKPQITWEPLEGDALIADPTTAPPPTTVVKTEPEPSGPTFANDRALWRDEMWHPQISSLVPIGFGPKGVMASIGLYGWDCTTSGTCTLPVSWADYQDQLERFGELHYEASLGFGDPEKLLGVTFTGRFEETSFALGDRNTSENKNIFSNYYVGVHLSRSLSPDTAVRLGIDNWIDVKTCGPYCGYPKSAYGVISQRIRIKDDQNGWFPNAYLTVGAGNGQFRSVTEKFQASVAAQRAAGCWTYGYYEGNNCSGETRAKANNRSVSYGQIASIGSAALEVYPGFNVIGEWAEGNLNAGFSVRPFKQIGLVFTTMWGALLKTCDWGCKVSIPDVEGGVELEPNLITERVKWSFNLSLNVKF